MKTNHSLLAVFLVLAVALGLGFVLPSRFGSAAPAPKPQVPAEADFKGKVLSISTDYQDKSGAILEEVRIRKIGERSFLVGKGVDDGRPETAIYKGRTMWISVEHVVQIAEFDSVDDVKKLVRQSQALQPPPPQPAPPGVGKQP
jgi:hypothetical protein